MGGSMQFDIGDRVRWDSSGGSGFGRMGVGEVKARGPKTKIGVICGIVNAGQPLGARVRGQPLSESLPLLEARLRWVVHPRYLKEGQNLTGLYRISTLSDGAPRDEVSYVVFVAHNAPAGKQGSFYWPIVSDLELYKSTTSRYATIAAE